jgi:hypothetical protein
MVAMCGLVVIDWQNSDAGENGRNGYKTQQVYKSIDL